MAQTGPNFDVGPSPRPFLVARLAGVRDDDILPLLLFIVGASVALCMPPHNDTWWLLRSGQEMLQTKALLLSERFSHTAFGAPLHNHEWLTQLIFYSLFRLGGPFLLTLFCAACAVGAVFGSWRMLRGGFEMRAVLLVAVMLGTTPEWAIRPQTISLALLVIAARLAITDRVVWLPALCVIWANGHGLVLFGIVVAGCSLIETLVWTRKYVARDVAIAAACVIAPMMSPLGWHYWPRVLETVTASRSLDLHEYRSAFELSQLQFWIVVSALLFATVKFGQLSCSTRANRLLLLISSVLAIAGALSVRNIPFFFLIAAPAISRFWPDTSVARSKPATREAFAFVIAAMIASAAVVSYRWRAEGERLGWLPMAPAASEAIRRCPAPIFNGFADGGPIMWFVPERQVFVDSRVEAYPLAHLQRSRQADVEGNYQTVFDEYRIRCAVVDAHSTMAQKLALNNQLVQRFGDSQWAVFERVSPR